MDKVKEKKKEKLLERESKTRSILCISHHAGTDFSIFPMKQGESMRTITNIERIIYRE
jgi:hypothetical protein